MRLLDNLFAVLVALIVMLSIKWIGILIINALLILLAVAAIYFAKKSVFEGLLPNIMRTLSLFERFYTFVNGVFDMTAIVFYLSVIVFFLFLCVQSLEKRSGHKANHSVSRSPAADKSECHATILPH